MSVMPPSPFLEFPSSDGGLRAGDVTQTIGSAVTDAPQCSGDTISPIVLPAPSETILPPLPGRQISIAGDELEEDRFMAEIEEPPAFITVPSQGYLLACEREQTEAIIEFLTK